MYMQHPYLPNILTVYLYRYIVWIHTQYLFDIYIYQIYLVQNREVYLAKLFLKKTMKNTKIRQNFSQAGKQVMGEPTETQLSPS